jgi:peptidoglycan/xylan/chitin deacetylase (PgdA/CDA1 family)
VPVRSRRARAVGRGKGGSLKHPQTEPRRDAAGPWALRRYHVVGLLLVALLTGSATLFSRDGGSLPDTPRPFRRIALTFDDGPHPVLTERLLDLLERERVAATFFVVGRQAERHPALLRAIARDGHELANHTYSHPNLATLSSTAVLAELDGARRIIENETGAPCRLFRPPGGRFKPSTVELAARNGYSMVLWSVFPRDHGSPPASKIHERVLAAASDGGVVLLHSGMENTLAALPGLIAELRARGYRFLTVSELLREDLPAPTLSAWYKPAHPPLPDRAAPSLHASRLAAPGGAPGKRGGAP